MKGTPQGGVLSPTLWNINFDDLLKLYDGTAVQANGFADDIALLVSGIDLPSMIDILQRAVDRAVKWGRTCGLSFSSVKTVIVVFTHKRVQTENLKNIVINDTEIPFLNSAKYLGVIFDSR